MSRAQRRASRTSARSRRVPSKPAAGRGRQLPLVPIAVLLGIVAVVGVVAYLIIQAGGERGESFDRARQIEADANPDLQGEFVNLPEIYGGVYGGDSPNTNTHVKSDVNYAEDQEGLPPVGGPHWGATGCSDNPTDAPAFCGPAPWGIYEDPWDPATLVHNLEHGGVVAYYNTEDQSVIEQLQDWAGDNDDRFLVLTPLPDMDEETVAITAWSRRDKFPVSEFDRDRLQRFLGFYECRFDPEDICNKK